MLRPTSSRPCPVSAVFLAVTVLLFAAVNPAGAESADEANLRNIAGASVTYTAQVRELLARGTDPNVPDSSGRTAVHAAAGVGAAATLEVLLKAGGDLHVRDRDGNTPLHLAASASPPILWEDDSVAVIRMLLQYGADPDAANQRGESPLHLTARSHDGSAGVMLLLGAGADPNRTNGKGDTPLHAALGPNRGVTSVVGALLHRGADSAAVNGAGLTPLMTFLRYGPDNGATVTLLLFSGADPDARNPEGETPLHSAIRSGGSLGKVEVVEALLAGNADPCMPDAEGYIPYAIAEEGGAIHQALDRAGGHDLACGGDEDQAAPPAVAEADRMMRAVKRSNLRSGPGTEHDVVGSLEIGDEVRITGETGEWLRIEAPGSGTAFVYGPLLEKVVAGASDATAGSAPGRLCPTDTDDGECWWEIAEMPGCFLWVYRSYTYNAPISWSGTCRDGKATGEGTLVIGPYGSSSNQDNVFEQTVAISQGKRHGEAIWRFSGGSTAESRYADGRLHGRSITYEADGSCGFYLEWSQGEFVSRDDECGGTSGTTDSNLSAQTQTEVCDDWNTRVFFRSADVEDVRACLRAGADIEANDENGTTPLHLAAGTTKFPEVVQILLDVGADPNAKDDSDRKTPLFSAVWLNHNSEVITSLLEAGADVHARDEDGRTPLHWAATHSTVGIAEILLDFGADPRARDRNGNEPLHDVAWSDDPGVIKALLEAGANPEARNEKDVTPLHVAAAHSDIPAIVTALLKAGADLEARDGRGWTPLHLAAAYNEVPSVVEALLHAGAGLETKSDEWGLTPLHFAAWKSETPDVIATLLDAGANPSVRTNSGGTPWDFAQNNEALQGTEVLDWLDPDAAVPGGPLHGSIAFSQDDDGAYAWGIAWSFDSSAGAEAEALGQCREYGGTRCAEAGWFQEACGALAIGDGNGYGAGWGTTTGEAERDALAQCRAVNDDCRIEVARCSQSEEAGGAGRTDSEDTIVGREPADTSDDSCGWWLATYTVTWNEEGIRRGGINFTEESGGDTRAVAEDSARDWCTYYSNGWPDALQSCDVVEAKCVQPSGQQEAPAQLDAEPEDQVCKWFAYVWLDVPAGPDAGSYAVSGADTTQTGAIDDAMSGCQSMARGNSGSCAFADSCLDCIPTEQDFFYPSCDPDPE